MVAKTKAQQNWQVLRQKFAEHLNVSEDDFIRQTQAEAKTPLQFQQAIDNDQEARPVGGEADEEHVLPIDQTHGQAGQEDSSDSKVDSDETLDEADDANDIEIYELFFEGRTINLEDMAIVVLSTISDEDDGKSFLEVIPSELLEALDISLTHIAITTSTGNSGADTANTSDLSFSFTLVFNQIWGIDPIFEIENPAITIEYTNDGYSGYVITDIHLGIDFVAEVHFPDLSIRAMTLPGEYALADLLAYFAIEPTGAGPFQDIKLASAEVSFESVLKLATLYVEFDDVFHLGIFEMNRLMFDFRYGWGAFGELSAIAETDILLNIDDNNQIDINLHGEYEAGTGWFFEADVEFETELTLTIITSWIGNKLGVSDFPIPESIEDLSLKSLLIHYDTMEQSFKFRLGLKLSDTSEIELSLEVHDQATANDEIHQATTEETSLEEPSLNRQIDISATLFVHRGEENEMQLAGIFDKTAETSSFLAVFHPSEPTKISLNMLLEALDTDVGDIGDDLAIDISSILLARISHKDSKTSPDRQYPAVIASQTIESEAKNPTQTNKSKGVSSTIVVIELGSGIELSSLGDLPVVGKVIGNHADLDLTFQLSYATRQEQPETIEALNALLTDYQVEIPADIVAGFSIKTQLRLGADTDPITLRFGSGSHATTNPLSNSADSDTNGTSSAALQQHFPNIEGNSPPSRRTPAIKPRNNDDAISWYDLDKGFGPIHVGRIGFKYEDGDVSAYIDASLSLSVLTVTLMGLSATFAFPVSDFSKLDPRFSLEGIGIDFHKGRVELSGALMRGSMEIDGHKITTYDGLVVIKAGEISLSAFGSFAQLPDGSPSAFIYGILNFPFGGPPAFLILGFAAGFGYNRHLIMPNISEISDHWLVADAVNPDRSADMDIYEKIDQVRYSVIPEQGQYFAAAGIHFSSFNLLDNFILVIVSFGNSFELDIVGISTLKLPPNVPDEEVLAEIQLALIIRFAPDEGVISVQGQLTSHSFLLSHDCHLTGGFAVVSWFAHEHEGDFVVTFGGYHPRFDVPSHYPVVPRIGFDWKIGDTLSITGGMYFALVPSAAMAGAVLDAEFKESFSKFGASLDVHATFHVGIDFLLKWKPFYYDISASMSVHIAVAYDAWFTSGDMTFDVSANFQVAGPEFHGHADLSVHVIGHKFSFAVDFGESKSEPEPLEWKDFHKDFLHDGNWLSQTFVHGIEHEVKPAKEDGETKYYVFAKDLEVRFDSLVPITRVTADQYFLEPTSSDFLIKVEPSEDIRKSVKNHVDGEARFGVVPMERNAVHAPIRLEVTKPDDADPRSYFQIEIVPKQLPNALWGTEKPTLQTSRMTDAVAGIRIRPTLNGDVNGASEAVDRKLFAFDTTLLTVEDDTDEVESIQWTATDNPTEDMIQARDKRNSLLKAFGFTSYRENIPQPLGDPTH